MYFCSSPLAFAVRGRCFYELASSITPAKRFVSRCLPPATYIHVRRSAVSSLILALRNPAGNGVPLFPAPRMLDKRPSRERVPSWLPLFEAQLRYRFRWFTFLGPVISPLHIRSRAIIRHLQTR